MDHPKARVFRGEKKVSDSYANKLGPCTWEKNFWALEKNKKQEYIIEQEFLTQSSKNTKHHVNSKVQMHPFYPEISLHFYALA